MGAGRYYQRRARRRRTPETRREPRHDWQVDPDSILGRAIEEARKSAETKRED